MTTIAKRCKFHGAAVAVLLVIASAARAVGPSSPYYLTNGDSQILQVGESGAVVNSWSTALDLYPLAVTNTVKLYDRGAGFFGNGLEYTLSGTPTGVTFPWQNGPTGQLLDGATDAVAHNYASEFFGSNGIWQYNLNWQNPTLLFTTSTAPVGVTYDRADGNLWISLDGGNIEQVTNTGQVLSQFFPGSGRWGALAWEPSTDTLWAHDNGTSLLRQWTTSGVLLQTVSVPALSGNIWGGEFSIVPEPSTFALAALGLLTLGVSVWARRRAGASK